MVPLIPYVHTLVIVLIRQRSIGDQRLEHVAATVNIINGAVH